MGRGGRVIYKKASGGRKRKIRSKYDADDDEDEEYVVEEDEDEESESSYQSDVPVGDSSDEESFDFSEFSSNNSSDGEEKIKIARSKSHSRNRKKSRVSDDEMEGLLVSRRKGRVGSRHQKSRDSDYEEDDEDDDDEDFSPDEDDFDEEEVSLGSKRKRKPRSKVSKTRGRKKKKTIASAARKRRRRTAPSSDDDFIVKDRVSVGGQRKKSEKVKKNTAITSKTRKKRSSVDSESLDSDFMTSDDDLIGKDRVLVERQRKKSKKVRKNTATASKIRKKRSLVNSESLDSDFMSSDDDFTVKDRVVVNNQKKNNKKLKKAVGSKPRRKRSSVDSESSDSDYVISDHDNFIVKDQVVVDKQQKKSKNVREKRTESKTTRKRSRSSVVSSDSSDFDDLIPDEEIRDLRVGGGFNQQQPKRIFAGRKKEEKGKEKEADDSGTKVCGICLTEEQKGVVQGLLNCCSHYFCFACIMEWSKVESRCPVCKRRFVTITKSGRSDPGFGMRKAVIRVQKRDQVYQPSEEELRGMLDPYENVVCMECQQGGDDNLMLLCDICDSSAHTYCVGLGREVPEGNWYCECCRSVGDGPSRTQVQDTKTDQGSSSSNLFPGGTERAGVTNVRASTNSPRPVSLPGQSSLRIDLNVSPRHFSGEDHCAASQVSGSGPSTLSGRRHIQQRIRILLSSNRPRQTFTGTNMPRHYTETNVITSEVERTGETLGVSQGLYPLHRVVGSQQWQQNNRPVFRPNATLAPCMLKEGSSFRHVDGAKEQVQCMVKSYLQNLSREHPLDRSTFKEIARNSTHTILAACGIEHRRSMVSATVDPPNDCAHDSDDAPADLVKGCCSSCFSSFVKDVVLRLANTS